MVALVVRWAGIAKVTRSILTGCNKSCDLYPALHRAIRGAQEELLCIGWGGATSQLDVPSLMPLSVAGCGRLQLGVPHWATSVDYWK